MARLVAVAALCVPLLEIDAKTLKEDQLIRVHSFLDKNGDGSVTLVEMMDHADRLSAKAAHDDTAEIFAALDQDGDKKLSLDEFKADVTEKMDHMTKEEQAQMMKVEMMKFRAVDEDGDGFVSEEEVAHLFFPELHDGVMDIEIAEQMRVRDKDGDGKLSYLEFYKIPETDRDHHKTEGHLERTADFEELDADKNGFLSTEEMSHMESGRFHMLQTAGQIFKAADTSGDGSLSVTELVDSAAKLPAEAMGMLYDWSRQQKDEL